MPIIEPQIHEIEAAAFRCFQQGGGGGDGHAMKDWVQAKRHVFMTKNYEVIARHALRNTAEERLGNHRIRSCRYCRTVKPNSVEWEEVHALPEIVGNKSIIAMDECPVCKGIFRSHDNDLGQMLQLLRNLGRIECKRSVPAFLGLNGPSCLDPTEAAIEIEQQEDGCLSEYEEEAETLDRVEPFTPLAVYKSLTKMALAVMPPGYLPKFSYAIDWIKKKNHADGAAEIAGAAKCRFIFQPGPMPADYGHCTLLVRKSPDALIPYMLFSLTMANQTFQIMVPWTPCDNHLVGHRFAMPEYPPYYGYGYQYGEPVATTIDLATPDKIHIEAPRRLTRETAMAH